MHRIRIAALFAALALVPSMAHAQSTITACYVPKTGSMYRIQAEGVPDTCKQNHVEFSWQSGGTVFTRRLSPGVVVTPNSFGQTTASCQAGEVAVGGGHHAELNGPVSVAASVPTHPESGWPGHGWFVDVRNIGSSNVTVYAHAICAKPAS